MSARERKPRTRWPDIQELRRRENRRYRAIVRRLIRAGRAELICPPRQSSAKWEVW